MSSRNSQPAAPNWSDMDTYRAYTVARARYYLAAAERDDGSEASETDIERLSDEHSAALRRLMFGSSADLETLTNKLRVFGEDDLHDHYLAKAFITAIAEDAHHLSLSQN